MFTKRKLNIQKRAESKNVYQSYDDKNRNPIYDIIGFLCILFAGILILSYLSANIGEMNTSLATNNLLGKFGVFIFCFWCFFFCNTCIFYICWSKYYIKKFC